MSPARKLLIGTWRSAKRRTLQSCHRYHCLLGAKKRRFGGLFGKLELRYTPKYVHHRLRGFEYRGRYDVVAEDAESIVIRIHSDGIMSPKVGFSPPTGESGSAKLATQGLRPPWLNSMPRQFDEAHRRQSC